MNIFLLYFISFYIGQILPVLVRGISGIKKHKLYLIPGWTLAYVTWAIFKASLEALNHFRERVFGKDDK